jgi:hypothetical protein
MTKFILALSVLLSVSSASAHIKKTNAFNPAEVKLCDFAPKNDLRIPDGLEREGGIDQETYNRAVTKVEKIYKQEVADHGGTLKINRMWSTAEVNSNATRKGSTWIINAYGGLARFHSMTYDGEIMVLCHEMGHHMGGFPSYPGMMGSSWASNEGQSDYFATMKCFRKVVAEDDNISLVSSMAIPSDVSKACQLGFSDAKEIALCKRSSMTGKVLAGVLYELGRSGSHPSEPANSPDFETPSQSTVTTTNNNHPLAQCRLDTYFSGAVCGVSASIDFSKKEAKIGACNQESGDAFGFRPVCWYKPGSR